MSLYDYRMQQLSTAEVAAHNRANEKYNLRYWYASRSHKNGTGNFGVTEGVLG